MCSNRTQLKNLLSKTLHCKHGSYIKSPTDIYGNMEAADTPRYKAGGSPQQSMLEETSVDEQTRRVLAQLIPTSADLNVRVWLDGVYTNVEDARPRGDSMKGREIYFKAKGRVPSVDDLRAMSNGGT